MTTHMTVPVPGSSGAGRLARWSGTATRRKRHCRTHCIRLRRMLQRWPRLGRLQVGLAARASSTAVSLRLGTSLPSSPRSSCPFSHPDRRRPPCPGARSGRMLVGPSPGASKGSQDRVGRQPAASPITARRHCTGRRVTYAPTLTRYFRGRRPVIPVTLPECLCRSHSAFRNAQVTQLSPRGMEGPMPSRWGVGDAIPPRS